jgi:hypothetical protein
MDALNRILSGVLSVFFLLSSTSLPAQVPNAASAELTAALMGSWTGVLEYRDYKSDGRVKLPTWLTISADAGRLDYKYIYDDGPTKIVKEESFVAIDAAKGTWTITTSDSKDTPSVETITGLNALKAGRGTLVLTGTGTDNDRKADVRTTVRIGRNILEILRETRVPGEEFKFRHVYTFTRAVPPSAAAPVERH